MERKELYAVVEQLVRTWSSNGKSVSINALRQWMQPHAKKLHALASQRPLNELEVMHKLVNDVFPEGEWQGAVALNQLLHMIDVESVQDVGDFEGRLNKFLEVWNRHPVNLSAFLVEWRRKSMHGEIPSMLVLETLVYDASKPSFFDPEQSAGPVDFFLNVLRYEFGVDVDGIVDGVKEVVGEKHVGDFMRLVDVDAPYPPEEFVERVDRAVEILTRAREQGVDVEEVVKEWDALADAGGERLEKLPDAVKAVAEREVRKRFWEALEAKVSEAGVPVIITSDDDDGFMDKMYSAGLVEMSEGGFKVRDETKEIIRASVVLLQKASPSMMYTTRDVEWVIENIILPYARDAQDALTGVSVLEKMRRNAVKKIFDDEAKRYYVWYAVRKVLKEGVGEQELAEAMSDVLEAEEVHNPEEFVQKTYNKLHEMRE